MKREVKIDIIAFFIAWIVSLLLQYISMLSGDVSKGESVIIFIVCFIGLLIYYEVLKINRRVKIK